jgi:hypothetical protein
MTLTLFKMAGCTSLALASVGLAAAAAQDRKPAPQPRPAQKQATPQELAKARAVWPAGLERLAGRYVFAQVASPGGLYDRFTPKDGKEVVRQVALPHLPAALREKLQAAEIVISDLALPSQIGAEERVSPSKRGKLRFYTESAAGKLVLRNLPGIGGASGCAGEHTGPVVFRLEHSSHSNPSVSGVLMQRKHEEPTWGVATLDHASLAAAIPGENPDDEGHPILTNARVLRSGIEIFAYVEWTGEDTDGTHSIRGAVRLVREGAAAPSSGTRAARPDDRTPRAR